MDRRTVINIGEGDDARLSQPNDVLGLARHLPALDPARYVDEQARRAFVESLDRWPVLAKLMGLKR
ncbi:hypothetical protein [Burkholderia ambifaria]|uniref:Uncharacterized protein n=2 Tax=Burkholderia ambifaria TaxID=152480 RepID=A0AA41JJT5_9BURK|nr:hypothetical protein [Burkholderia ambifaria]EDT00103.1 conserved hypothetical protein [Burkholderia ambifaria IOP40-10]MBR8129715.1 hypothetical protein [Burkholderia ambifaria]PRD98245.1 hypothetical protein C6P77_20420 [Burkholderia ambifaria]